MQTGNAPKGQRAYILRRDTGKPWEEVAAEVGSASPEAAIAGAKKYATNQDLPWPIRTIVHEAQEKAQQDEARAQARRDARIYQRVASGTPVSAIAGMSPTNVYRALDRHVEATGAEPIGRNAERAYDLRRSGSMTWAEIAKQLGYVRETAAIEAARGHAHANDLPWPIEVDPNRKDEDSYVGKPFYEAVADGASWSVVAVAAGKAPSYVKARAKVYAEANNRPWPI